MPDRELDMMADQTLEVGVGVLVHRFRGADQLVHRLVEQGGQDLVLAGEVAVDRRPGEPRASAQLVDARTMESLLVEQFRGDIENLPAPVHSASVARCVNDRYTPGTLPPCGADPGDRNGAGRQSRRADLDAPVTDRNRQEIP